MFRFLSRLIALFLLAFAVMYVVIDAARTIAGSELVYTALETTLDDLIPEQVTRLDDWAATTLPSFVQETLLATAMKSPTSIIAALLAFLFYALSRKAKRSIGRFSLD